jgi:hypothetical protein
VDLGRVAAEALAASEAAEAQHSAEEHRLSAEREQLEARSAQVRGALRGTLPPLSLSISTSLRSVPRNLGT